MTPWPSNPAHARWLEAEGDRLLAFGRPAATSDAGFAWLSETGTPRPDVPATGEAAYVDWYATWWRHVADCFLDTGRGSWHHELSPTNQPSSLTWSGKPDTDHAFQATLIPRLPLSPTLATALRDGRLA